MKVAIGASYNRKHDMRAVADELKLLGVNVVSRWLEEPESAPSNGGYLRDRAHIDLADVRDCDYFVRFVSATNTGGHLVEMGYALALGKTVIVVGGKQNIYDHLLCIRHARNLDDLKRLVSTVEVM